MDSDALIHLEMRRQANLGLLAPPIDPDILLTVMGGDPLLALDLAVSINQARTHVRDLRRAARAR